MNEILTYFIFPFLAVLSAGFLLAVYRQMKLWDQRGSDSASTGQISDGTKPNFAVEKSVEAAPSLRQPAQASTKPAVTTGHFQLRPVSPPPEDQMQAYKG